jgi:hypothetical protein
MLDMVKKDVLPSVSAYVSSLADTVLAKKAVSADINADMEISLMTKLSELSGKTYNAICVLDKAIDNTPSGNRLEKDDLDEFDKDMKKVSAALRKIICKLRSAKSTGQRAYAQGLKAYREAPAQLEEGREKIIEGRAALAAGNAVIEDFEERQELAAKEVSELTGEEAASDKEGLLDTEKGLAAVEDEKSAMTAKKEADSRALNRDMAEAAAMICASLLMLIAGSILILKGKNKRRR